MASWRETVLGESEKPISIHPVLFASGMEVDGQELQMFELSRWDHNAWDEPVEGGSTSCSASMVVDVVQLAHTSPTVCSHRDRWCC